MRRAWNQVLFWLDTLGIVRLNGWLLLAAGAAVVFLVPGIEAESEQWRELYRVITTIGYVLLAVFAFYILFIVVPYAWFLLTYYILRGERDQILFKFPKEAVPLGETFDIDAILKRKLRLRFGAMKFRLVFYDYSTSPWCFLLHTQRRKGELFNSADRGAIGSFAVQLPHIGRYRTRYSVVKFEDPLGLFSLPLVEKEFDEAVEEKNFYLYCLPPAPSVRAMPYYTAKRNIAHSSDQAYRVTEDYFDTKRYEPTDDIRRMMWPVYARTRQLLIRKPDRDSSIDSDIDVYILFHNPLMRGNSGAEREYFDRYIMKASRYLESLLYKRQLAVRIISDCNIEPSYKYDPSLTEIRNLKRSLVCNEWHEQQTPDVFLHGSLGATTYDRELILILHPFIDPGVLPHELLEKFTSIHVTDLDSGFHPDSGNGGLQRILYRPDRGVASKVLARGTLRKYAGIHRRNYDAVQGLAKGPVSMQTEEAYG